MDDYRTLRKGIPGRRLRNYVDKRRGRQGGRFSVGRVLRFAGGLTLIVIGLGVGWLPGPGGFLAIIGLAMIAIEIPIIADTLDRFELLCRRIVRSVKHFSCRSRSSQIKYSKATLNSDEQSDNNRGDS